METTDRSTLVFHGIAVIFLGLLAGFPFVLVVTGDLAGEVRAWRMAHLEGVLNGMLMIAVAAAGGAIRLSRGRSRAVVWCLCAAGYGNVLASVIGASTGVRGLEPVGPVANLVTYGLFLVAVVGVLAGLALAAQGALRARRLGSPL